MNEYDESVHGWYGSMAFRKESERLIWSCYDSSDYHFYGVIDDYGNIARVSEYENIRGY